MQWTRTFQLIDPLSSFLCLLFPCRETVATSAERVIGWPLALFYSPLGVCHPAEVQPSVYLRPFHFQPDVAWYHVPCDCLLLLLAQRKVPKRLNNGLVGLIYFLS